MHPLDGPRLKMHRAWEHLEALDKEVAWYDEAQAYEIAVEIEGDPPQVVVYAVQRIPPPPDWASIIGDIVHNLRSALDQLTWQLALLNSVTPYARTAFPIFRRASDFSARTIKSLSEPHQTLVEGLQPYNTEDDATTSPLWWLHELSNTDKHRTLPLVGMAVRIDGLRYSFPEGTTIRKVTAGCPTKLEQRTPVARFDVVIPRAAVGAEMQVEVDLGYGVQFGKDTIGKDGQLIMHNLRQIHESVGTILSLFEREFP